MRNFHFLLSSIIAALVQGGWAFFSYSFRGTDLSDDHILLVMLLATYVLMTISALVARVVCPGDKELNMFKAAVMTGSGTVTGEIAFSVYYLIVVQGDMLFPMLYLIGVILIAGITVIPAYLTAYACHVLLSRAW